MNMSEQTLCGCGCNMAMPKYDARHRERKFVLGHNLKNSSTPFVKGMTPWNKGKKGLRLSPDTEFKSGHTPVNKIGDGVTSENRLERLRFSETLRTQVLERDNYTCQVCGQRGGSLQVDHIKSWAKYPELRFDSRNCRTLCMACHYYVTFKRKMPEGVIWGNNLSKGVVT